MDPCSCPGQGKFLLDPSASCTNSISFFPDPDHPEESRRFPQWLLLWFWRTSKIVGVRARARVCVCVYGRMSVGEYMQPKAGMILEVGKNRFIAVSAHSVQLLWCWSHFKWFVTSNVEKARNFRVFQFQFISLRVTCAWHRRRNHRYFYALMNFCAGFLVLLLKMAQDGSSMQEIIGIKVANWFLCHQGYCLLKMSGCLQPAEILKYIAESFPLFPSTLEKTITILHVNMLCCDQWPERHDVFQCILVNAFISQFQSDELDFYGPEGMLCM